MQFYLISGTQGVTTYPRKYCIFFVSPPCLSAVVAWKKHQVRWLDGFMPAAPNACGPAEPVCVFPPIMVKGHGTPPKNTHKEVRLCLGRRFYPCAKCSATGKLFSQLRERHLAPRRSAGTYHPPAASRETIHRCDVLMPCSLCCWCLNRPTLSLCFLVIGKPKTKSLPRCSS